MVKSANKGLLTGKAEYNNSSDEIITLLTRIYVYETYAPDRCLFIKMAKI